MESKTYFPYFTVAVFFGLPDEITKFNLKFMNGRFVKLFSNEFENRLSHFVDKAAYKVELANYENLKNATGYAVDRMFALFPLNFTEELKQNEINHLLYNLLIAFPANIKVIMHIDYEIQDYKKAKFYSSFIGNLTNSVDRPNRYKGIPMKINPREIKEVNRFIKMLSENKTLLKDYDMLIGTYLSTFVQTNGPISFVYYVIALESLVDGTNEIGHQIARMCAILNSKTKEEGELIYSNFKKFYELRSKIVHGTKVKRELIDQHYFYLQALVSKTIIQIVYLKIPRDKLPNLIIKSGFGDRKTFIKRHKTPSFNKPIQDLVLTPFASHLP